MKQRLRQGVSVLPSGLPRERLREKGQFWTPDWIADAMVAFVLAGGAGEIFDPAVGAGAFFRAARRAAPAVRLRGTELHADALAAALQTGLREADLQAVAEADFVLAPPSDKLPAIVANPPYIRHHRLPTALKTRLRAFSQDFLGHAIDGRAGFHIYFLLRALERLAPGGRLAFIVPADICEGVFAPRLWQKLASRFRLDAVVTFAPAAAPFPGVDTNAIILFMTNSAPQSDLPWARCEQSGTESLRNWIASGFRRAGVGVTALRRTLREALDTGLSRCAQEPAGRDAATLGDFATTMRGIATGANDFFFLTTVEIAEHHLPLDCFRRAIGRTRDVCGDKITAADLDRLDRAGRPTLLLSLDGERLSPTLKKYIGKGEASGLDRRSLIATRRPWFKMEVRQPPPFLFAYLGRRSARFIRNLAEVVPLTGFLCVYPKTEFSSQRSLNALWQVLSDPATVANLSRVGKSYGDGAIKVEPRALERLPLPEQALAAAGLTAPPGRPQMRIAFAE